MAEQRRHAGPAVKLLPLAKRTARYTIVGAICAALNNLLIIGGDFLGVGYVAMSVAAFVVVTPLGVSHAYRLHLQGAAIRPRTAALLLRGATGFPLFILLMAIFCSGLGMPVAIATPLCTVILYAWNYALAHWAIRGRADFTEWPSAQVSAVGFIGLGIVLLAIRAEAPRGQRS